MHVESCRAPRYAGAPFSRACPQRGRPRPTARAAAVSGARRRHARVSTSARAAAAAVMGCGGAWEAAKVRFYGPLKWAKSGIFKHRIGRHKPRLNTSSDVRGSAVLRTIFGNRRRSRDEESPQRGETHPQSYELLLLTFRVSIAAAVVSAVAVAACVTAPQKRGKSPAKGNVPHSLMKSNFSLCELASQRLS